MVQLKDQKKLLVKWHLVKTWASKSGLSTVASALPIQLQLLIALQNISV